MIKGNISLLILFFISICLSSCNGIAELFHGSKPEAPLITYTVYFDQNGANGIAPPIQTVKSGTIINLPDKGTLINNGNVFAGWNESASGIGTTYSVGASIAILKDTTFYAQWLDASTPQFTVTFNANGATSGSAPSSKTAYIGTSITIPNKGTLASSGKTFEGWNTQANGNGTNYVAGSSYKVMGDIILYAKWLSSLEIDATVVPGSTLTNKLTWLRGNVTSNKAYIVEVDNDESLTPQTLSYSGKTNITILLRGKDMMHTISLSGKGSMFVLENGVTLQLDNNITLQGINGNTLSLIIVNTGGTLIMNPGTIITGNTTYRSPLISYLVYVGGGGVYLNGGTFIMNGGEISGNGTASPIQNSETYSYCGGGGIYIYSGTFTMNGGEISNNTSTIYDNNHESYGGGVYLNGGTFSMCGGEISSNAAITPPGYSPAGYGGGVYIRYNGMSSIFKFIKTGGTIYGYSFGNSKSNLVKNSNDVVQNNRGHSIYATYNNIAQYTVRREMDTGPEVSLTYSGTSSGITFDGDWE